MAEMSETAAPPAQSPVPAPDAVPDRVYRHRLPTRLWHWVNAAAIIGLFMSGLMIFNAHPRLYWGQYGANPDPAWLEIGNAGERGYLEVSGVQVTTTGVLGRSSNGEGGVSSRAFPRWITLPGDYSLAIARHWHLGLAWFFAVGYLLFFLWSIFSRHRHAHRDLGLRLHDLAPGHLWQEIKDHARLRFPHGLAALRYNGLQKISYFGVIFLLIPLMIFTGLAMSPGMDAGWPWIVDVLGGRQTARSIHFIACWLLFGFFVVHILMVVLAGPINELRSMLSGWYHLRPEPVPAEEQS
jgi:thiosulfate reductase cytochrome b subunit